MRDDTEEMQRVVMVWPHDEDSPVECLCIRQSSRMVVLEGNFEGVGASS